MISLIVAHDENRCIGKDGWMPWDLKEDLKQFRTRTLNQHIVMGRTTFEALKKPLPKRYTYVITHQALRYDFENVEVINDFNALMKAYQSKAEPLIICGGAKIYQTALPYVDEMWISLVEGTHEGDTYFPNYDVNEFIVVSKEQFDGFLLIHYRRKEGTRCDL